MTGDTKTESEGKSDQVAGKIQNTVGGIKEGLRTEAAIKQEAAIACTMWMSSKRQLQLKSDFRSDLGRGLSSS